MRFTTPLGIAAAALVMQASLPAQAGLIGNGTNTVSALFFLGAASVPSPPYTNPAPFEIEGPAGPTNPPPPPSLIPAHFIEGASDGATIDVGDTTITITNDLAAPFCSVAATPCPDVFTGFAFTFSAGVDIAGVTVDAATAPGFFPAGSGLQLLTPTDIIVNLVGDAPNIGDKLILDLTFPTTTPPTTTTPEPMSLALLGVGLVGIGAVKSRTRRRAR